MNKNQTTRVRHVTCGGVLRLYTGAEGEPVWSRTREGCLRAYCEECSGEGTVTALQGLSMTLGKRLPPARIRLDPMSASRAQLGLAGSRRDG